MKVIELLTKIANGEEVPKKIKYAGIIWEYDNTTKDYVNDDMFLIYKMNSFALNKSFEIIEEETKPITKESIEAAGYACGEIQKLFANGWQKSLKNKSLNEEDKKIEKIVFNEHGDFIDVPSTVELANKINEIIDVLNEMREGK